MPKAVLDTTVLVSAFLRPTHGGASFELLRFAREGRFELHLSNGILDEVAHTLMTHERSRTFLSVGLWLRLKRRLRG